LIAQGGDNEELIEQIDEQIEQLTKFIDKMTAEIDKLADALKDLEARIDELEDEKKKSPEIITARIHANLLLIRSAIDSLDSAGDLKIVQPRPTITPTPTLTTPRSLPGAPQPGTAPR
jgi:chromosome segregation ATPase